MPQTRNSRGGPSLWRSKGGWGYLTGSLLVGYTTPLPLHTCDFCCFMKNLVYRFSATERSREVSLQFQSISFGRVPMPNVIQFGSVVTELQKTIDSWMYLYNKSTKKYQNIDQKQGASIRLPFHKKMDIFGHGCLLGVVKVASVWTCLQPSWDQISIDCLRILIIFQVWIANTYRPRY